MTALQPIGLFDSGVGGLSVWREVTRLLPHHPTIYVADTAYCPYGPRPDHEIVRRAKAITQFLLDRQCQLVVVACNTASAAALEPLRTEFEASFVGMEPAIKPAAQATQTGHIGVLATAGTIRGNLFQHTSHRYAHGVNIHTHIGEGLVEQVEAGQFDTPQTAQLLRQYLDPMLAAGVDQIVLGCTHYPLLMPLIRQIVNGRAGLIDPAQAVARQVQRLLPPVSPAAMSPRYQFYTTGPRRSFQFADETTGGTVTINFEFTAI